jgi:hypothetical protein
MTSTFNGPAASTGALGGGVSADAAEAAVVAEVEAETDAVGVGVPPLYEFAAVGRDESG